jgi:hypothetical protein
LPNDKTERGDYEKSEEKNEGESFEAKHHLPPHSGCCPGLFSLCPLCDLCVSVLDQTKERLTTETQRTQRVHRELANQDSD